MTWIVGTKKHYYIVYDGCGHLKEKCACTLRANIVPKATGHVEGFRPACEEQATLEEREAA